MNKVEIIQTLEECIQPHKLCRVFSKYDINYYYFFPLKVNNKYFLGLNEQDFIFDGFTVRRVRDITNAEIKDDLYLQIHESEGNLEKIITPDVDIDEWVKVFRSLESIGNNVIIEEESIDPEGCQFAIGRIEAVRSKDVLLRAFDADGIWQEEPWLIPYTSITAVSFETRYIQYFSKYLPPIPETFKSIRTYTRHL